MKVFERVEKCMAFLISEPETKHYLVQKRLYNTLSEERKEGPCLFQKRDHIVTKCTYSGGFGKSLLRKTNVCFLQAHALEEELRGRRKESSGTIPAQKDWGSSREVLMIKFLTPETEGWL